MPPILRTVAKTLGWPCIVFAMVGLLPAVMAKADNPTDPEIATLIQQLGDPDCAVRDRAQEKLEKIGERAYNALTMAANHPDLEIAARARYLLQVLELPVIRESDLPQVKKILEGYKELSASEQLRRIRALMALPQGNGYRAACRLAHIENSPLLSKYIAVTILNRWPLHAKGRARMREAVKAEVEASGRVAARWLAVHARLDTEARSALDDWRKLVDEEKSGRDRSLPTSTDQIVAALFYDLAYWESVANSLQQAKNYFDQAQEQKLALSNATLYFYLDMAYFFRNRGMIDWAVGVYGRIPTLGMAEAIPLAQLGLAEMLHDMGRNEEAAAALDVILDLVRRKQVTDLGYLDSSPEQIMGRKHYFYACTARDQGDQKKYRAELLQAVKSDPNELDALIALYRIPDLEPSQRKQTLEMIQAATEKLRQEAATLPETVASSDEASAHNQLAWIIGNTTGDMNEALEHALRAVELSPESGAYLDTLAHVYFYGLKDYQKAVQTQTKAVEFMPHSGLIRQKCEQFRKAAAEKHPDWKQPTDKPGS